MKKLNYALLSVLFMALFASCGSDDDGSNPNPDPDPTGEVITKTGFVEDGEVWTSENGDVYLLDNKVVVPDGATLTIEAGTIIKAEDQTGNDLSALVVARGGTIIANGTASNPIIFTSKHDGIMPGETESTLDPGESTGLWGGVLILGAAPISKGNDLTESQVEGLPANEEYGLFGGNDANDDSGEFSFVSIRFGGGTIATDNEINGLSLAGVGAGTNIHDIEVVSNDDDGVEWWGGSVNVTNAIVWGQSDDGFDTDEAWSGTLSNGTVIMNAGTSGSGLEMDGPNGSAATEDSHTLENITLIGAGGSNKYADFRDGLLADVNNVLAYGFGAGSTVKINGEDSYTEYVDGRLTISNWEIVLPEGVEDVNSLFTAIYVDENEEEQPIAGFDPSTFANEATSIGAAGEATVGANMSAFDWTFSKAKGAY